MIDLRELTRRSPPL